MPKKNGKKHKGEHAKALNLSGIKFEDALRKMQAAPPLPISNKAADFKK